jgi:hypothetical protein
VLTGGADASALAAYDRKPAALPAVLGVDGPVTAPGPGVAYVTVLPKGEAVDSGTQHLVKEIRAVPTGFRASVTGQAAVLVDSQDRRPPGVHRLRAEADQRRDHGRGGDPGRGDGRDRHLAGD